jgi:hypothetical protein
MRHAVEQHVAPEERVWQGAARSQVKTVFSGPQAMEAN